MKVFAKDIDNKSIEVEHSLGISIEFKGKRYTIGTDNHDRLVLRSIDGMLMLKLQAANATEIDSE